MVVKLSSDASLFAWGSVMENPCGSPLECHGLWSDNDKYKSIAAKEALALAFSIQSASASIVVLLHTLIPWPSFNPGRGKVGKAKS